MAGGSPISNPQRGFDLSRLECADKSEIKDKICPFLVAPNAIRVTDGAPNSSKTAKAAWRAFAIKSCASLRAMSSVSRIGEGRLSVMVGQ
ncbi:MAG: hypothetical protein ACJAYH_002085 [Celeribacter sp.]